MNEPVVAVSTAYARKMTALPHQPDHIISRRHGGSTSTENLAWACAVCNLLKGPEIAAIDTTTGQPTRVFNPRDNHWPDHFRLEGARIVGMSPEGRLTVSMLQFNRDDLVALRKALIAAGRYP